MQIAHVGRALKAVTMREITKFAQQRGRLLSALVRPLMWLAVFAAGFYNVSGLMLGSLWLFLSVHIKQLENFAGAMNFVMFPMFFFSSALYPLWKLREGGSEALYYVALANPFTHAVELIRFALYGDFEMVAAIIVSASTVVFFLLAVFGYNPQRGMIRRAPQPA